MSKNYNQLSSEQRYQIEALLKSGSTQKEIAVILKKHPSTICRELKRNIAKRGRGAGEYHASNAQRKTKLRHADKYKHIRFNEELKVKARSLLMIEKYSPVLINVQLTLDGYDCVSHETIYKWIWNAKKSNRAEDRRDKGLYLNLAHGRRRRKRGLRRDSRGIIPNRVSIEVRPGVVKKRIRLGDMEVDLMMGRKHNGALLVITDRATLKTKLRLLKGKESGVVQRTITRTLLPLKDVIRTLTFDNDQAFSKHLRIGKTLQASTYFTRPYTSQDKGTVENRIGVIRRFLPKKTDLTLVTNKRVREIEKLINNRPVKKFNYKTPNQVFSKKIALIS